MIDAIEADVDLASAAVNQLADTLVALLDHRERIRRGPRASRRDLAVANTLVTLVAEWLPEADVHQMAASGERLPPGSAPWVAAFSQLVDATIAAPREVG